MKQKIIQKGAEAIIILSKEKGKEPFIIKDRIKKGYRSHELDERIRKIRTKAEARLLIKASEIINAPKPFFEPSTADSSKLRMPFVKGKKISNFLDKFSISRQKSICKSIGENVAKIHKADIIHGDLTTSNMILSPNGKDIVFIDFGLGFISPKIEDKAVDIHLLKEALEARHFKDWKILFDEFLKGYSKNPDHVKIIEQMKKVEARGRYRN